MFRLRVGADAVASAYNVNARGESAMCVLDAGQMVGRHNIYMSLNDVDWMLSVSDIVISDLNVLSMEPSLFSVFGGTMVTFRGDFGNMARFSGACKFAAQFENALVLNTSTVVCRAPPFSGSVEVKASVGDLLDNFWMGSFSAVYTSIIRVMKVSLSAKLQNTSR